MYIWPNGSAMTLKRTIEPRGTLGGRSLGLLQCLSIVRASRTSASFSASTFYLETRSRTNESTKIRALFRGPKTFPRLSTTFLEVAFAFFSSDKFGPCSKAAVRGDCGHVTLSLIDRPGSGAGIGQVGPRDRPNVGATRIAVGCFSDGLLDGPSPNKGFGIGLAPRFLFPRFDLGFLYRVLGA